MPIPRLYRTSGENIVSVGYTDVATGRSMTNLYAGLASEATVLTNVSFISDVVYKTVGIPGINFDLQFDLPQTIYGDAVAQVAFGGTKAGVGAEYYLPVVSLAHIDIHGTSSDIISGQGHTLVNIGAAGQTVFSRASLILNIPVTRFKRGEKLRMMVRGSQEGGGTPGIHVGCDPSGRAMSASVNGDTILQTPFRVEL